MPPRCFRDDSKTAPRRAQDSLASEDVPRRSQDAPKLAQDAPKTGQDAAKRSQNTAQIDRKSPPETKRDSKPSLFIYLYYHTKKGESRLRQNQRKLKRNIVSSPLFGTHDKSSWRWNINIGSISNRVHAWICPPSQP